MALVRGPFTLKYGSTTLSDVSEISWDYSPDETEITMIDGRTIKIPTSATASVEVTLAGADIAALSKILPAGAVTQNGNLTTGETANKAAFEIKGAGACSKSGTLKEDLDIIGCEYTTRLVDAEVALTSIDYEDNVVQTMTVTFTAAPDQGKALIQMFENGSIA